MRVSAIRFGSDLWQLLETEAAGVKVSVSQYVREAALIRVAAAGTARGEDLFQLLAEAGPNAAAALAARPRAADPAPLPDASAEVAATRALGATSHDQIDRVEAARDAAQAAFEAALAVTAESKQARRQTKATSQTPHRPASKTSGRQRD
jgi:hypothetical protein